MTPKHYKYKAFISYSHQDKKWGDWLHRALETYRVPKGLVGKETGAGVVPKRLFPIFRDREELPTSHELGKVIDQALRDSSHLVIICSPRSAKSLWVNEEIKQFKRLGKSDNILCLIVDGEPNATDKPGLEEEECFPEAAKYEIGQDGELSGIRTEPIAADAREGKDGKRNALLKLVAGLLAVGFDDLKQRDLARKQKRMAIFSGVSMALVAIMAGLTFWALDQQREAERQRQVAVTSQKVAVKAQKAAGEAQKEAEWESYVNQIALADSTIKRGDILAAKAYLWGMKKEYRNWEWGRLLLTHDPSLRTINVRSGFVICAIFAPNGNQILTVALDGSVKIWDARTGLFIGSPWQERGELKACTAAYSSDGSMLAIATVDGAVSVLDAITGGLLHSFREHKNAIRSVGFSPDGKLVASVSGWGQDALSIIWDCESEEKKPALDTSNIRSLAFSPNGENLVTTHAGGKVNIWDLRTRKIIRTFHGRKSGSSYTCSFSPDGRKVLVVQDNRIEIWKVNTEEKILTLQGHEGRIHSASFSADGTMIATCSNETARIWDTRTGDLLKIVRGHARNVSQVDFHPNGKRLLTGSFDRLVRIWALGDEDDEITLKDNDKAKVRMIDFSPDSNFAVTASNIGTKLWNAKTGAYILTYDDGHSVPVNTASFSPKGDKVITARDDNTSIIWETQGKKLEQLKKHKKAVLFAEFSADGTLAVTTSLDKTARIWDVETGDEISTLKKHTQRVNWASFAPKGFAPEGQHLVTGGDDGKIIIWDIDKEVDIFDRTLKWGEWKRKISTVMFSPDGGSLAASTLGLRWAWVLNARDHDAKPKYLWNRVNAHTSIVGFVSFSPDGKRLVTTSQDKTIKVWDARTQRMLLTLPRYGGKSGTANFSPDGQSLAVAPEAKILKALDWNITPEEYKEYKKKRYEDWLAANDPETE